VAIVTQVKTALHAARAGQNSLFATLQRRVFPGEL
jgi:hypothetical protein